MEIDNDIKKLLNEIEIKQCIENPDMLDGHAFDSMAEMVAHLRKIGWLRPGRDEA